MRKGRELFTGRKYNMTVDKDGLHRLSVLEAREIDSGMYTAVAQNENGKVRASAELHIKCK